jgi:hypothetical protein
MLQKKKKKKMFHIIEREREREREREKYIQFGNVASSVIVVCTVAFD